MAHEAAVHRVDAELALDGIDEVLRRFLAVSWWTDNTELPVHTTVAVTSAGSSWTIAFTGGQVTVSSGLNPAAASVSGEPEDVLLWLWGRRGDDAVSVTGDADAASQFRQRLAEATG